MLYTFLIYPATVMLVGVLAGRRKTSEVPQSVSATTHPSVAIIVAACNEAEHLRARLEDLRDVVYPADRQETIVVTDDGSTDGTIEIAKELANHGQIRHVHCPCRGKNACLDAAVSATKADILVFKDATGRFASDAILRLTAHFRDPAVGCVGGAVVFENNGKLGAAERVYWVIEQTLRRGTEVLGYMPSAAGGIHAMRREIYQPVSNDITRDMVDPIQATVQGYRAIKDDQAICYEVPWRGVADVYTNRIRVTKRAWAAIRYNAGQLWAARRYGVLFQLFSHKVLRFLVWLPMIGALISSVWLAPSSTFYLTLSVIQSTIYGSCLVALLAASYWGKLIPVASFIAFLLLNLVAMADGTIRFLAGRRSATWKFE